MKINAHNCEAFFLDYYDGTLSAAAISELFLFLQEHPEFQENFESFSHSAIPTEQISLLSTARLKREESMPDLSEKDFLLAGKIENQLSDQQIQQLEKILQLDPSINAELDLMQQCTLLPANVSYDKKTHLKKSAPIITLVHRRVALAASILILLGIGITLNLKDTAKTVLSAATLDDGPLVNRSTLSRTATPKENSMNMEAALPTSTADNHSIPNEIITYAPKLDALVAVSQNAQFMEKREPILLENREHEATIVLPHSALNLASAIDTPKPSPFIANPKSRFNNLSETLTGQFNELAANYIDKEENDNEKRVGIKIGKFEIQRSITKP